MGVIKMYNTTLVDEADTLYDFAINMNALSSGLIGSLIVLCVFIIVFVAMKRFEEDVKSNFIASSFITTVFALFLWGSEMITWHILIIPALMLIASILVYLFTQD